MVLKTIILFVAKVYMAICTVAFTIHILIYSGIHFRVDSMKINYCLDMGGRWNYDERICEYKSCQDMGGIRDGFSGICIIPQKGEK